MSGANARLILGTAGHVDHGKTSLIRALTGVDTDRLPEEKARGITIELGFARLVLPGERVFGVVDVPGHEKFVRAMLAGASGVDAVLLVVAADEGVMPQTREHLDICGLLGVRRAVVALTKVDRVEPELAALAAEDVGRALGESSLAGAPVVPVSSVTGQGLDELRRALAAVADALAPRADSGPVRLPLDRVFTLRGLGTVVTGTLASGRLVTGEALVALPSETPATARGLEVHGERRSDVAAGERVAANLAGTPREAIDRGDVLVRPGEVAGSSVIDVDLAWLRAAGRPLRRGEKLLFHALATQENAVVLPLEGAELPPGGRGIAQIRLGRPVALLPGDRFVLRGFRVLPGYGTTVGGGRVLRVLAPPRRRPDPAAAAFARTLDAAATPERLALEAEAAGAAGLDVAAAGARLGLRRSDVDAAVAASAAAKRVRRLGGGGGADIPAVAAETAIAAIAAEALAQTHAHHEREPLAPGVSRESLRALVGRRAAGLNDRVFAAALESLVARKMIVVDGDVVRAATFSAKAAEGKAAPGVERVHTLFLKAGLAPPWPNEVPRLSGLEAGEARAALDLLLRRGDLVRVRSDLYFDRSAMDDLRARLKGFLDEHGQITAQEWKTLTGQSRKYAIPLAEHFDAEKLTLRVGEIRKLRGR